MTALYVSDGALFSEAADVVRLFTGETHIRRLEAPEATPAGRSLMVESGRQTMASVYKDGRIVSTVGDSTVFLPLRRSPERARLRQRRHQARRALYRALSEAEQCTFPWGSLTGIRPVKLFRELAEAHGDAAAAREFEAAYGVGADRVALSRDIYSEQRCMPGVQEGGLCVYIGIPFCPSRCRYCSFIAQDVVSARRVREVHLEALLTEMRAFAAGGAPAAAVYIGGGTPTTLRPAELERLIRTVRELWPGAGELTLEAGRPDTITSEVLDLAASLGVSRISVNPQTASDETLRRIGRAHTAADYRSAMRLAGPYPMLVNNDMILGLPGEHAADVAATLDEILAFQPDNITVHALAVKKAADLAGRDDWQMMEPGEAAESADMVRSRLEKQGYRPYYLYRQKYMSGNLENVGYARPGAGCLYNVLHMEELASVAAFGAGAVSKRVWTADRRIERCANVKNAEQYVARLTEMVQRKQRLFAGGGAEPGEQA